MTFECTLNVSGISPQVSAKAFINSYQETSKVQHYEKYHNELEQYYQNKINNNIGRYGLDMDSNQCSIQFDGNQINFISEGYSAIQYEYGYDDYAPKRFMQSAVTEVTNKIANYMISDEINIYQRQAR